MTEIIEMMTALLSPIVALTVTYIAYQQWKLNAAKEKREAGADRLKVYMVVKKFLESVDQSGAVDPKLYADLQESLALADFLFDSEVRDWLDGVDADASSWLDIMRVISSSREGAPEGWVEKELAKNEKMIDRLQEAHCDLFSVFENKII